MKCGSLILGALVFSTLLLCADTAAQDGVTQEDLVQTDTGKETFLAQKCDVCHGVSSRGVAHTSKIAKLVGPDLDEVSDRHDAPWMIRYVKREQVGDNGKKHTKPFKGTDEELQAIVDWLSALKGEAENP